MEIINGIRKSPLRWLFGAQVAILVFLGGIWGMFFGGKTLPEIWKEGGWAAVTIRAAVWIFLFLPTAIALTQIPLLRGLRSSPKGTTPMTVCIVGIIGGLLAIGIWALLAPLNGDGDKNAANHTFRAAPPERPRFSVEVKQITVIFGGSKFELSASEKPVSILRILDGPRKQAFGDVTASYVNGEVLINAKLGSSGVELKNNRIRNLPEGWDTSFDYHSLEIVNENGNPVFQLIYRGDSIAIVNGIFQRGENAWAIVRDSEIRLTPGTPEEMANVRIPRMFAYPDKKLKRPKPPS